VAVGDMLGVDGDPNATDSSALLRKIGTTGWKIHAFWSGRCM